MIEQWKEIKGFDGLYSISTNGKVRANAKIVSTENGVTRCMEPHEMSQYVGRNGYLRVNLSKGKVRTSYPIHRLVAQTFIPNPMKLSIVNHKNENKHDNRVCNLEWCTNTYNLKYGTTQRRRVKKIGHKVIVTDLNGNNAKAYISIREAAKATGCPLSEVYKVCIGKKESYKSYIFKQI